MLFWSSCATVTGEPSHLELMLYAGVNSGHSDLSLSAQVANLLWLRVQAFADICRYFILRNQPGEQSVTRHKVKRIVYVTCPH
jgi:hypothetical protein